MISITDIINFILHISDFLKGWIATYQSWTYLILFTIIFCETGFVGTPYFPGDSLIFAAGALAASGYFNPWALFIVFVAAAMAGDNLNYWIGYFIGPRLFKNEKSRLFKKKYLDEARAFYQKHGGKTVVICRFMPFIRTFAPFVAGIGSMKYPRYFVFEIIGTLSWVTLMLSIGFLFGNIQFVKDHMVFVFLAIIIISFIPLIVGIFYDRLKKRTKPKKVGKKPKRPAASEE